MKKGIIIAIVAIIGIIFVLFIVWFLYQYISFNLNQNETSNILDDSIEECARVDGIWKTFSNSCADSCSLARSEGQVACLTVLTDSCDCGPDRCWNGRTCEPN